MLCAPLVQGREFRLDYLYTVAAEGNASGGHVAVRFDGIVYHFQHVDGGLIRLERDRIDNFQYHYRFLENRDLEAWRLGVDAATFFRLRDRFENRYQIQRLQFVLATLLVQEERWLSAIVTGKPVTMTIPGAGLFLTDSSVRARWRSPVLAGLAARLGNRALDARIRQADTALAHLTPVFWDAAGFRHSDQDRVPSAPYAFSERYQDWFTRRLALQTLRQARPLRPGVLRTADIPAFRLSPSARAALCRLRGDLESRIGRLVATPRPDTGVALFVLMARFVAAEHSCVSGRLAFLDRFRSDAEAVVLTDVEVDLGFWRAEMTRARNRLWKELMAFARHGGRRYAALMAAANRYDELRRGVEEGRPVRLFGIEPLPLRPLRLQRHVRLPVPAARIEAVLTQVRRVRRFWQAVLRHWYRYRLLQRNCVTEVLRLLDVPVRFEKGEFMPFRSTRAVARHYTIRERLSLPSYRHLRLRQAYRRAPAWRVYLREANTLTATLYRPQRDDSLFLFFTDDIFWARPLYGGINAAVALLSTGAGLVTLPFDGGRLVRRGMLGVFSSLVELGFGNVRKGSYRYLPPVSVSP